MALRVQAPPFGRRALRADQSRTLKSALDALRPERPAEFLARVLARRGEILYITGRHEEHLDTDDSSRPIAIDPGIPSVHDFVLDHP